MNLGTCINFIQDVLNTSGQVQVKWTQMDSSEMCTERTCGNTNNKKTFAERNDSAIYMQNIGDQDVEDVLGNLHDHPDNYVGQ